MNQSLSRTSPKPRVAVLGGGISGLSAAFWLSEFLPGAEINLFEEKPRAGGVVHTTNKNGYLLEAGPLAFPGGNTATGNMLKKAGLENIGLTSGNGGGLGLWDGKRLYPFPRTPWAVLSRRTLSPLGLLRLLKEPFVPVRRSEMDESIRDFFHRRTGAEFLDRLMEPFAACILAGDPAVLSMQSNLPRMRAMEKELGSLAKGLWKMLSDNRKKPTTGRKTVPIMQTTSDGMSGFINGLEAELKKRNVLIRLSHRILSLRRVERYSLEWTSEGETGRDEFDFVISCMPAYAMTDIGESFPAEIRAFFKSIPHSPVSLLHLAYPTESMAHGFKGEGFLSQGRAEAKILSCFFPSRMAEGRCPANQEMSRVMLGGARQGTAQSLNEESASAFGGAAMRKILGLKSEPIFRDFESHARGIPQLVLGHAEKMAMMGKWLEKEMPGLYIAGTSFHGAGVENAVQSGKRAAEKAAKLFAESAVGDHKLMNRS